MKGRGRRSCLPAHLSDKPAVNAERRRYGGLSIRSREYARSRSADFESLEQILLDHYRLAGRRSIGRVQDAVAHLRGFFGRGGAYQINTDLVEHYTVMRQGEGAAARRLIENLLP